MKKLFGIFVVTLFPLFSFSQDKIDSLKKEIAARSGIDQFEPMVALSRAWWALDSVHHSLFAMENARALALRYGDTAKITHIRGLTSLCTTEIADPMAKHYFDEFTKAAEDLFVNVGNYFSREKGNIFES